MAFSFGGHSSSGLVGGVHACGPSAAYHVVTTGMSMAGVPFQSPYGLGYMSTAAGAPFSATYASISRMGFLTTPVIGADPVPYLSLAVTNDAAPNATVASM